MELRERDGGRACRRRVDKVLGGGCTAGTYQHIVPVGVGAVGEASRLFVIEFTPGGGGGAVGVAAIRVVGGEVGGSAANVWSEELGGAIVKLSAQLDDVLAETGILLLELADAIQGTHVIVGETHRSLESGHRLLELGERVRRCGSDRAENGPYLFDVGLSLGTVASLGLCIPAALTIILGREGGARVGGGGGYGQGYVVRRRRHCVRQ